MSHANRVATLREEPARPADKPTISLRARARDTDQVMSTIGHLATEIHATIGRVRGDPASAVWWRSASRSPSPSPRTHIQPTAVLAEVARNPVIRRGQTRVTQQDPARLPQRLIVRQRRVITDTVTGVAP